MWTHEETDSIATGDQPTDSHSPCEVITRQNKTNFKNVVLQNEMVQYSQDSSNRSTEKKRNKLCVLCTGNIYFYNVVPVHQVDNTVNQ